MADTTREALAAALQRIVDWDAAGMALTEDHIAEAKAALAASVTQPAQLTAEQIEDKITDYFAESWAINQAWMLLDEFGIRPAATPEQAPAVQAGALTDERIDAAWWSLGTEPDGSNLAGGCTLAGWRRAVRWAEATLATTPAVQAEQPAGWSTPPSTWQESEAHAAPRGQAEDAQRLEYGSLGFGWTFAGIELADGDKRLMSMLVNAFGSDHPAVADLTALLFRARASDARKGEAS